MYIINLSSHMKTTYGVYVLQDVPITEPSNHENVFVKYITIKS